MNTLSPARDTSEIQLSPAAPLVRVTAGVGSAGQKTWNLRRPVTLIGARRPAHIVLHDNDVSAAHCLIVNTGREVLIKDLQSSQGTVCNRDKVDLAVLSDGDVITVGATKIQVAIRVDSECNGDSGANMKFVDPTKLHTPLTVRFDHADREWCVDEAVTLIGRHPGAKINLNLNEVERRHAVLFSFGNGAAVYDLAGRSSVSINGRPCSIGSLRHGDRIGIGPVALSVTHRGEQTDDPSHAGEASAGQANEAPPHSHEDDDGERADTKARSDTHDANTETGTGSSDGTTSLDTHELTTALGQLESELSHIESSITSSWQQLNGWQVHGDPEDAELDARLKSLDVRESELNDRDAVIRGQLHDVTRYHEQVSAREKDLEKKLVEFQEEIDRLSEAKTALEAREKDVVRRMEELKRREHVVAQRWTRLQRASCPHCSKPVSIDS